MTTVEAVEAGMVRYLEANPRFEAVFMRRTLPIRVGDTGAAGVRYTGKTHDRQEDKGLMLATWTASGQPVMLNLHGHIIGKIRQHEAVCAKMLAILTGNEGVTL